MLFRWLTIASLILLIPIISAFGILQTQIQAAGSANQDPAPILDVNGYLVTERDYRLKIGAVESNLDHMQQVAATDTHGAAFNAAFAYLITETGIDVVALAALIADVAVYQWGVEHGLEVSQSELDAALNDQRQIVTTADDPSVERHRAYIAEVGEDLFWNEILPRNLKLDLMSQAVRQAQVDDYQSDAEERDQWQAFQHELFLNAAVNPLNTDLITPTMIEQAIQYLTEDIPALYADYASR